MIPNTKVFVGSLPGGTKPEELRRLFENFGIVTECDIMNKCGFVWMQTEEMAQNAIASLNNTMLNGQSIVVEPGRIKDRGQKRQEMGGQGPRGGGSGGGFQRGGNRGAPGRQGGQDRSGGGGPMRRGRDGPMRRNTPYGGRSDFGGNRGTRPEGGPMPPPPAFGSGFDDNFGFSNQDRRGFALPNQYDNSGPQQRGGFQRSAGHPSGGGFRQGGFGGNRSDPGRQGGGGFNRGGFNSGRQGAQGGPKPNFNRGGFNSGNFGEGSGGGRPNQGSGANQAYNQQFPPLGAGGPGPRNSHGPPRMQNRRFQ